MKPILFNTEMVKAILEGRKTCTRRLVNGIPSRASCTFCCLDYVVFAWKAKMQNADILLDKQAEIPVPCRPGDILYVRETWSTKLSSSCKMAETSVCPYESCKNPPGPCFDDIYIYKATDSLPRGLGMKWKPSIHMPKEAARIFLRVTDVRAERLRDITEADAVKEGLYKGWRLSGRGSLALSARQAFMWLWETITRDGPAYKTWACNPWVWVIEFEKLTSAPPKEDPDVYS